MFRPIVAIASTFTLLAACAFAQAPIERPGYHGAPGTVSAQPKTQVLRPAHGVQVLTDGQVSTVSASATRLELRLDSGRANVSVDHPGEGMLILVDLPGGQADLVRDGFYTFNAATNQVAVLHGEAIAFAPDAPPTAAGKTIREMQGAVLGGNVHPEELYEAQAQADLLPAPAGAQYAQGAYVDDGGYGYGGGDGFYGDYGYGGYPLDAGFGYYGGWGYPWGWNYGWGYPIGFGFGWGGGYWGGYRGGYYGGYPGGVFGRRYGYGGGYGGGLHGYAAGGHVGGYSGGGGRGFAGGHH